MSQYSDRYHEHQLHADLEAVRNAIENADVEFAEGETRDGYDRFRRVIGHVENCLNRVDPELVTGGALTQCHKQMHALKDQIPNLLPAKNWDALNNAADAVLDQIIARFPQFPDDGDGDKFVQALDEFRNAANEELERIAAKSKVLQEHHEQIKEGLGELHDGLVEQEKRFDGQKARIDEIITAYQNKFSEEQQARNTQFAENQSVRQDQFSELKSILEGNIESIVEECEGKTTTMLEEHSAKARKQIGELNSQLEEAERIVGLIGNTGMTGHFQKVANQECEAADKYRKYAMWFLTGMVIVFLAAVLISGPWFGEYDWGWAVFRMLGAAIFGIPASMPST